MHTARLVIILCVLGIAILSMVARAPEAQAQQDEYGQPTPPAPPLTPEEHELLLRGEISELEIVAGGAVGTVFGFGSGHAVQGLWSDKGWIFTVGEAASLGLVIVASDDTCAFALAEGGLRANRCTASFAGALAFLGLRIWELVDVWTGAPAHNRKVRHLRHRAGYSPSSYSFYAVPTGTSSGVAGLSIRF